ncbi:hypothetical protein NX059_008427 [Plenodomus lindquistii]|nr:hypothetical protein NX059_008427 [Plenodomus lindquistii]
MADPGYNPNSWHPMSTASGAPDPDLNASLHSPHALSFSQSFAPLSFDPPYAHLNNSQMMPYPDMSSTPFDGQNHARSPYPSNGGQGHQMFYSPPPHMHPYGSSQPRPPPAFRSERHVPRTDLREFTGIHGLHGWSDYPRDSLFAPEAFGYNVSMPSTMESTPFARRPQHPTMGSNVPRYDGMEPTRTHDTGNAESRLPQITTSRGALSYRELPVEQGDNGALRRASMFMDAHNRRSDRSNSLRTSNRRSFDRYSVDLPQSSTSSDADEAAARVPPPSRARQRMRGARSYVQRPVHDPNIASLEQIQALKEKLPRRLPSELSDNTSKACDICSKDYSLTEVKPSEDAEIAVELPCGHCFGESCINTWFDTCRTHKNKVTCPMCRKQLIELPRPPPRLDAARYSTAVLHALQHGSFHHPYLSERRAGFLSM